MATATATAPPCWPHPSCWQGAAKPGAIRPPDMRGTCPRLLLWGYARLPVRRRIEQRGVRRGGDPCGKGEIKVSARGRGERGKGVSPARQRALQQSGSGQLGYTAETFCASSTPTASRRAAKKGAEDAFISKQRARPPGGASPGRRPPARPRCDKSGGGWRRAVAEGSPPCAESRKSTPELPTATPRPRRQAATLPPAQTTPHGKKRQGWPGRQQQLCGRAWPLQLVPLPDKTLFQQ